MKTQKLIFILILQLLKSASAFSQYQIIEPDIVFGSRVNNPIEIELLDKGDRMVFYNKPLSIILK
jgi:hypothetical protein